MTRAGERWVNHCARGLNAAEREAVLGDLIEANASSRQAICQVLGLVARRQISLWGDWRPWLALVGIVGVSGFLLYWMALGNSVSLVNDWSTRARFGAPYENGLTPGQNQFIVVSGWIAVASWSWTSGLLAGVLARKTWWLTALVFCAIWFVLPNAIFLNLDRRDAMPLRMFAVAMDLIVFVFPVLIGINCGRRGTPRLRSAICWGVWVGFMVALMTWTSGWWQEAMVRWSEGVWHPGAPWTQRSLRYLFLSWPAAYLIVLTARERLRKV